MSRLETEAGLESVEIFACEETHIFVIEPQNAVKGLKEALVKQDIEFTAANAVGDLSVPEASSGRVQEIIRGMNVIPKVTQIKSPKTTTLAV